MEVGIINPIDFPGWDEQIQCLPGATIFHSSYWARVLVDSYGYKPVYFVLFDDGILSGCLPIMEVNSFLTGNRGVSLPFTDFCDPLALSVGHFGELFKSAVDFGRGHGWKSLEIRGGGSFLSSNPSSSQYFQHTLTLLPHQPVITSKPSAAGVPHNQPINQPTNQPTLPLPFELPISPLFASFHENTRRNIRKAIRSGVRVEILRTENSLKQFYRLNQITRRDHCLPPQPYRFFREIFKNIISQGFGFVVLAFLNDIPIASSVYFHYGSSAIYKYGASDKQYQNLRSNNLVMWEGIKWLSENGYKSLSFGRTDFDHDGLRRFKLSWGTTEEQANYFKYDLATRAFVSNEGSKVCFSNKIVSFAPLSVLRVVGSILYRHMG
jgi:hypothetical protein